MGADLPELPKTLMDSPPINRRFGFSVCLSDFSGADNTAWFAIFLAAVPLK